MSPGVSIASPSSPSEVAPSSVILTTNAAVSTPQLVASTLVTVVTALPMHLGASSLIASPNFSSRKAAPLLRPALPSMAISRPVPTFPPGSGVVFSSDCPCRNVQKWLFLKFNKLSLNIAKTEYILIAPGHKINTIDVQPTVKFNSQPVKRVKCTKVLGIQIDDHLSRNQHIVYIENLLF